jgi:V8-like Glu-specific endopeptidase
MMNHYKRIAAARTPAREGGFESAVAAESVAERTESTEDALLRIVKDYLHDDPHLVDVAKKIVAEGGEALRILDANDANALERRPELLSGLEAIVRTDGSRPSFLIRNGDVDRKSSPLGGWANLLDRSADRLRGAIACVGRIDVPGTSAGFMGTGFLIQENLILTNRHVLQVSARLYNGEWKFSDGAAIDFGHEFNARDSLDRRKLKRVVFCGARKIEFDSIDHSKLDLALIELESASASARPSMVLPLNLTPDWAVPGTTILTVGYPGSPQGMLYSPTLLEQLFQATFGYKRIAPGELIAAHTTVQPWTLTHDATTLGGNSGSVVLLADREQLAAGLHYGGRGVEPRENWGHVLASVLNATDGTSPKTLQEVLREHGIQLGDKPPAPPPQPPTPPPPSVPVAPSSGETAAPPQVTVAAEPGTPVVQQGPAGAKEVVVTIPITLRITLGAPVVSSDAGRRVEPAPALDAARVERAAKAYWDARPAEAVAVRVGYLDNGDRVGDRPCIAVSVKPDQLRAVEASAPTEFQGVPVRYLPAGADEQVEAFALEAVDSIAYDDNARTADRFALTPVQESMEVTLVVGPEYSWDQLQEFLKGADEELVSAIYEFHARHIADAIEERLKDDVSMQLVLDNKSFSKVHDEDSEFDRVKVFDKWSRRYKFERVVAPTGTSGLISDSYHIKVTVRNDNTFWLSSGNWKADSSQPVITAAQRAHATVEDLPGNREWHVIIKNKTLATRFRSHIRQDFKRSTDLGAGPVPERLREAEAFVDVPLEAVEFLERRPPGRLIKPKPLGQRKFKVQPLLTPDDKGEVYSEAVLQLIRSARKSLLFQIPYIGMPPNPRDDRGYIDELIKELTDKLKSLEDARLILRVGGQKYSSPLHAAWYFKSKDVDIDERVRVIENHHTKGMIVDGKRILIGSHNWSKSGVTLNRDASLLFDDADVAAYFTEAFEVDWARSNPVRPRRFVREQVAVREAVGAEPPPGYRRVRLSEWLKDD